MRCALRSFGLVLCIGAAVLGCDQVPSAAPVSAASATIEDKPEAAVPSTAATDENPIAQLNNTLEAMGAEVVAEPPSVHQAAPDPYAEKYEELAQEIAELRADVKRLQDTMDLTVSYVVGDLQEENRRLREQLVQMGGASAEPVTETNSGSGAAPASLDDTQAVTHIDFDEAGYKVIKEWGRSPEEVKELNVKVPSLRGMICAVSPGLNDAELSDLGRKIRAECDGFENIVIDVFDDEAAAHAYADRNAKSTARNVLTIQKDGVTGQDVILLNRNGVSIQVPR